MIKVNYQRSSVRYAQRWMRRKFRREGMIGNEWHDLPDKVLRSNDACRDSVAKGVQLNCLVGLQVFLAQEDVEVGVLLDWNVDLVWILRADSLSSSRVSCLSVAALLYHLRRLPLLSLNIIYINLGLASPFKTNVQTTTDYFKSWCDDENCIYSLWILSN